MRTRVRRRNGRSGRRVQGVPMMLCGRRKVFFFILPYWKDNLLRHNLDVMHIEKNVMDNILGTILDIKGKTKDNLVTRLDLQEMGLRPKLHPFTAANGKTYIPAACHMMSREDKKNF
jgi:hypothetical protein